MRVHLTGSRGFVAQHLWAELEHRGHDVTGSDVESALGPEHFLEPEPPDVVVHAGAIVGRELRGLSTEQTVTLNATSTAILANACSGRGVPLVYVSTSEVYGPRVDGTLAYEDDPLVVLPHNLYGLTKRWGEDACRLSLPPELLTIARLSMPYGPGHEPGSGRAALTNFLWAAMSGEPLVVHRGARRSWCWIGDTVRALAMLAEHAAARGTLALVGKEEPELEPFTSAIGGSWLAEPLVVNVGRDDNELDMREVASLALSCVRNADDGFGDVWGSELIEVDPPEGFTLVKRLDTSRLEALGWRPTVELAEGMETTRLWLAERARLIRA